MSKFYAPIAEQIWKDKYQWKSNTGEVYDHKVEDTWRRVAKHLASVEKDPEFWEEEFYGALEDWKFIPAGRIVAGAGTGRNVTLFNCFVMGTIPDSMDGIFDMLKEAALTMQQGGGIGYDFSTIRPSGSPVVGVDADASGPLSFMDVWDAMCRTVMSAGSRRGAMMATMRCDHPDIHDFIKAKQDSKRLRMFNMSVLVTDDFMEAVKNDKDWELQFGGKVYDVVKAQYLWDAIMKATYDYAEPGVIFIDRINQTNNLNYIEEIAATNPCGEQPLPPYGACLLGSVNLTRFVVNPFTDEARIDGRALANTINLAVRMMDNVVDVSNFPLEKQREEAKAKRRIGLGVTGVADMLAMLGLTYGSDEAEQEVNEVLANIEDQAYFASANLAKEKGTFPLYEADPYINNPHIKQLSEYTQGMIYNYGLRNSHLTSIAPTGTISLYAGNVSSGIEPIFAFKYERKILQKDGSHRTETVKDYAVQLYEDMFGEGSPLPSYFVSAQTLSPEDHVKIQAVAQKWVDSSISKTINCPEDISFEEFKEVYLRAYDLGCKGCTTYRPNEVTGSVLTVSDDARGTDDADAFNGACTIEFDETTGQLIRSCE